MVKKLIKRGDRWREGKLRASLRKAGVRSSKHMKAIVDMVKSYVGRTKKPTTLKIRRIVEKYLRKHLPKVHKKYKAYKKK